MLSPNSKGSKIFTPIILIDQIGAWAPFFIQINTIQLMWALILKMVSIQYWPNLDMVLGVLVCLNFNGLG